MHHKWKVYKIIHKNGKIEYDKGANLFSVINYGNRCNSDIVEIKMIEDFGGFSTSLMADIYIDDLKGV